MRSGECDVVSLYVLCCSVNESVCCVFVNCLVKQFAICLGGCYFVVECYGLFKCCIYI